MPSIDIIDGGGVFESVLGEWQSLYDASPYASPFQSPQWIRIWTATFGKSNMLKTIVVREGDDLVGLYPMVQTIAPWRSLRPAGIGPSDYLGPLLGNDNPTTIDALAAVIKDVSKHHLVDLHQLPSDHPFASQFPQETQIVQAKCLILDLPYSFEDYVAGLSKSLRYDVRRLAGKALKEKGAYVQWADEETMVEFADQFFDLHKARWKSRGLPGAFMGRGERFQKEWMNGAIKSGTVIMNRLVCNGTSVGSVYAMRHGKTCYFYQAGMDPASSALSPGTILVAKMIERAIDLGCTTFDFMRGDEPYKHRWKPNRERVNSRILIVSKNVVGKTGMWWNGTAWRVELKVRRRLEGKSLRPSKASNQNS